MEITQKWYFKVTKISFEKSHFGACPTPITEENSFVFHIDYSFIIHVVTRFETDNLIETEKVLFFVFYILTLQSGNLSLKAFMLCLEMQEQSVMSRELKKGRESPISSSCSPSKTMSVKEISRLHKQPRKSKHDFSPSYVTLWHPFMDKNDRSTL